MQSAQLDKLPGFVERRRHNFRRFLDGLGSLQECFILPVIDPRANPSPFGFPITVREGIDRNRIIRELEEARIETRLVFGGHILRQPGFQHTPRRVHGTLEQADLIMRNTFFIGVYPGITDEMADYMIEVLSRVRKLA